VPEPERFFRENEHRLIGFRAQRSLAIDRGNYRLKTLEDWRELRLALRLRHDIFHTEHHGRTLATELDVDELDLQCDHLGLFDMTTGDLVGAYRLAFSGNSDSFYARRKFRIEPFLAMPGRKLELGRACVRKDFRNGAALTLLWRGIFEYARLCEADYLFGSASIRLTDPVRVGLIHGYCRELCHVTAEYPIQVRSEFVYPELPNPPADEVRAKRLEIASWIPPLFQSYLRIGARVAAPPAQDTFLFCADFLMVLPFQRLDQRLVTRFSGRDRSVPR
jgi:putative hemolysin